MALELYTAPTAYPVSLAEIKTHLRLDVAETSFDSMLAEYLDAATRFVQEHTGTQLVTATYKLYLDSFYCGPEVDHEGTIRLPMPPLATVSGITYYDSDDASQTLSSSYYVVDAKSLPGRIVLATGYSWPVTYSRPNAVTITYTAGYGAAAAVPETCKQAIRFLAATWFNNAETISDKLMTRVPFALESLLQMESSGLVL